MMSQETISPKQLFALMVLFELGTALVVPIGLESGHAIWLSILLALPGGMLLYWITSGLYNRYPELNLSGCMQKIVGKWIGRGLSLLYLSLFMHFSARNLRETGNLLLSASYDKTPLLFINAAMIIAVVYMLRKGIGAFAKMAEIYIFVIFLIGVISNVLIVASGLVQLRNLFPLQMRDVKGVLASAYPEIWMFPFGELFLFLTLLPYLGKKRSARTTGMLALLAGGLLLSFTHAVEISVLGEKIYARSTFPLFSTISLVNVANFIQRLDAFVILAMIICAFFKMTAYCYGASIIAAEVFQVRDMKKLAVPVGVIVLLTSILIADNYVIFLEEGKLSLTYILPVSYALVPAILFIVDRVRSKFGLYR